ncbi:MAG: DNA-3-methyladenine glycosylase [Anaerolineaceae bacterium]|nr:DNA-3-methyladenine glycosylase [Anaerolineaceae bacterium]
MLVRDNIALPVTPPFNFHHTLRFLGQFPPAKGEQAVGDQQLTKAIMLDGQPVAFRVTGTAHANALRLDLFADQPVSDSTAAAMQDRAAFFLSLNDDLTPFYALAESDPPFASVVRQLYGYHHVKFLTPFENAVWAVLSNRNRLTIASAMKARLIEACGGAITINGDRYTAFPEPQAVLETGAAELEAVIGHAQKSGFVLNVARAFAEMDEGWLRDAPYDEVESWLLSIKGIGPWSANFVMIRSLGRMDALKVPESRLMTAVSRLYGRSLNDRDVIKLAQHYAAYQGYWAHYVRAALS